MPLWIHESLHLSIFAVLYFLVSLFYKPFKDVRHFLIGFISAVLIDLDHVLDYFLFNGFSKFDLFEFLSCKFYDDAGRAFVLFHGWEYLAALLSVGFLIKKSKWRSVIFAFALGMFAHLLLDSLVNGLPNYFYFFSLRALNGFKL